VEEQEEEEVQVVEPTPPKRGKKKQKYMTLEQAEAMANALAKMITEESKVAEFFTKPTKELMAEQRQAEFQAKRRMKRQRELERQQKRKTVPTHSLA
jgi:hypothetical protein